MPNSLEQRFTEFLKGLSDSEWLDGPGFCFPPGVRKADFLLNHKKIIAEVKTVKNDPQPKIDKRMDQYLKDTGAVVFGTVLSTQLFKNQSESDTFHNKVVREITRNTEEMCRSANEQIEQTSQQLGIDSAGLLIVLNESITLLDPELVAYRICEYLNKNLRRIDYCLLIFESHEVSYDGVRQNQMLVICACRTPSNLADDYLDGLMQRWAEHNGSEYIRRSTNDPAAIAYYPKREP